MSTAMPLWVASAPQRLLLQVWGLGCLAPPRSRQPLSCELPAPDGSLRSPEVLPVQETPLCTTLEHAAANRAGTGAARLGSL